ncbi:MAG: hypothetical protein R3C17_21520 [Planctomycetaceae bacterium]
MRIAVRRNTWRFLLQVIPGRKRHNLPLRLEPGRFHGQNGVPS